MVVLQDYQHLPQIKAVNTIIVVLAECTAAINTALSSGIKMTSIAAMIDEAIMV